MFGVHSRIWMLLLALLVSIGWSQTPIGPRNSTRSGAAIRATRVASENDGYVGSEVCGKCHTDIYETFKQTDMGRSMSSVTPSLLQSLHIPATFYDQRLDRHYDVYVQNQKLYQSESAVDGSGKELFREQHQLQWIIGSGAAVVGGIVQRDDFLFEAPLALYTKPKTWELAPGYAFADLGFSRLILAGCIFCHSGRSKPVSGTSGRFDRTVFSEMPIGCENCHGPGAAHIKAIGSSASYKNNEFSIVNPARLTSEMANNICMACHEIGDERILKPGKTYQDVRPGTPLDNTLSILMVPPTPESPPQTDHLQHYYSMTLSKCYRASGGRLRCITCHDPHVEPSSQEASSYFNKKCLTCHTDQSCKLSLGARQQSHPADDCISCHMPKRKVGFIAHSSLTNHLIRVRLDEPFPDVAFSQTTISLPDLIHLNPAPGKKDVAPPLLTLLQAYGELAAYRPEYVAPYLKVLDKLEHAEPDSALLQAALGRRCLKSGKPREAVDHLKRSLAIGPPQGVVYSDLSEALNKLGQREEALAMLQRAILLDPFNPTPRRLLVFRLIDLNQYSRAQAAMNEYLQIFPQDSFMRQQFAHAMEGTSPK
jgi:hypothetical protein